MSANVDQKRILKFGNIEEFESVADTLEYPGLFMIGDKSKTNVDGDSINKTAREANLVKFPSSEMKDKIISYDTDGDGELSKEEVSAITSLPLAIWAKVKLTNEIEGTFDDLKYFTGLTALPHSIFKDNTKLTSVKFPANITQIDQNAFSNTGLVSVNANLNGGTVAQGAFGNCSSLTNVVFEDVTVFGNGGVFMGSANLETVTCKLSSNTTCHGLRNLGSSTFNSCTKVHTFDIEVTPDYNENSAAVLPLEFGWGIFVNAPALEKIIIRIPSSNNYPNGVSFNITINN